MVVLTRGITADTSVRAAWKGAVGPVSVLVHSEFSEDHPLLTTIRGELADLAELEPTSKFREVRPPDVHPRGAWMELLDPLADPEINVVVIVAQVRQRGDDVVLLLADEFRSELRIAEFDEIFRARADLPPPELVILETLAARDFEEQGFGLTATLSGELARGFGSPAIGICHTAAYVASLPNPTGIGVGGRPRPMSLTAHAVDALRKGVPKERIAYVARRELQQSGTPIAVPVAYLPTDT